MQRLLTELGFDLIIDVDLATRKADLLGEAKSFLKRDINCDDFPMGEIRAGMVHPEDARALTAAMQALKNESTYTVDFRYRRGDGVFFWCRCKAVVMQDETGKPYRCICKLTDIDDQKRKEQNLLDQAQRDSLTGLYNNMTTEILIDDYLSHEGSGSRHGLLVIDIDNFKLVNDSFGHKAGDQLLKHIAEAFKVSCRSSDIVGRIGGDEFVMFLKNVVSAEHAMETANMLRAHIQPLSLDESGGIYNPVCSIGVSLYPDHGNTYSNIFRLADAALYDIKENGKNGVKLCRNPLDIKK